MTASAPRSSPLALTVLALLHYKPLHPYGVQRLIKDWGKEQVVNVSQRASLYRTIERLNGAGLIAVRETGRDQQYPERTVYEITDAGRETARAWLEETLSAPRQEFPEFPAALSNLLLLTPEEMTDVLERRAGVLAEKLDGLEAAMAAEAEQGLPRITRLETEYLRAVTAAELAWVRAVVEDLLTGALSWSREQLDALAAGPAQQ
ncbi:MULTISPECIES: PadR family transcriptional regulator [unclassified Streptomyces]|uniref:PadR family transcriptional regulator n=1 Tax=unclassified Streptomyces TaxID=2593676 RepID=UPI002E0EBA6A|nr:MULTISPECIES: PadR family transcriptional regulator [unclassified Streptomyces]WSR29463.1 PadR family transcriptional regulator [Streptomyces sp. NBC_01205]